MNDREERNFIRLEKLGDATDEELMDLGLSDDTIRRFREWQRGPEAVEKKSSIAPLLLILIIIGVCMFFGLGQAGKKKTVSKPAAVPVAVTCTLSKYKEPSLAAFLVFADIVDNTDYSEPGSRQIAKTALTKLLARVDNIPCKNTFPLKHETLEYSVYHLLEAIKYTDNGNNIEASRSLDKALLNAERYANWSLDVD